MADAAVADATATSTGDASAAASSTVNTSPWYSDWLKQDGSVNVKSYERLPDHLKALRPTLERQNNVEGILQVLDHNMSVAGKKALAPLPADAPDPVKAERKALLDSINGVPKEAKEYGVTKPADLPDAVWHQPLADTVTAWAHKHSVAPAALKELIGANFGFVKEQMATQAKNEAAFWAKEQATFDSAITNKNIPTERASALIEKGAQAFGMDLTNPQTQIFLKGAQARLMCMTHAIAMGEDSSATGNSGDSNTGGDINDRIKEAKADPAYWNKENKYSGADHQRAVERVNELLRMQAAQVAKKRS